MYMTDQEINEFLLQNYMTMPQKAMAEHIGRSHCLVVGRLRKMGVEIPVEVRNMFKKQSQIKSGAIPFNKGKKQSDYMSAESIKKTSQSRFKKGRMPHNTKYDGAISLRKDSCGASYYYYRVSIAKWVLYQRLLWEIHIGKIPEKHIVTFKDENSLNVSLSNLECISMKENLSRNSAHRFGKEIFSLIQLRGALNRKIKSKLKQNEK